MHVFEIGGRRVLIDCGLFQGRRREAEERNRFLPFDPCGIDAMILSHAHVDHSGNIPTLVNQGFRGPIYTTHATRDLCAIMLRDSGRIHERDADWYNRKVRRRCEPELRPLYTEDDAIQAMELFEGVEYGARVDLAPGMSFELRDAGHVLGSSMVVMDVVNGHRRRICFTGDLGRREMPLSRDPARVEDVDVLIMESTYGDRLHDPATEMKTALRDVVTRTAARGGKVLIPAFALERSQTVVYLLHQLRDEGAIPPVPIYVDSPLTADVTEVFRGSPEYFDPPARAFWQRLGSFEGFRVITDVEDSKALHYLGGPAVIIAGSGMCEAGRILHHLRNNIEDERNTVLLVGFQARHTLGRRLLEHRPEVRIFGLDIPVEAEIVDVRAFSCHADQNDLLDFARACRPTLHRLFLVHGEEPQALALAQRLQEDGFDRVAVPQAGAFYDL